MIKEVDLTFIERFRGRSEEVVFQTGVSLDERRVALEELIRGQTGEFWLDGFRRTAKIGRDLDGTGIWICPYQESLEGSSYSLNTTNVAYGNKNGSVTFGTITEQIPDAVYVGIQSEAVNKGDDFGTIRREVRDSNGCSIGVYSMRIGNKLFREVVESRKRWRLRNRPLNDKNEFILGRMARNSFTDFPERTPSPLRHSLDIVYKGYGKELIVRFG